MADVMPEVVFCGVIVFAGGVLGATLVGIYFVVSDILFAWHTNEVFASQSIINYRNFLRMRIAPDGKLTIFPIGLREVPRKWRLRNTRQTWRAAVRTHRPRAGAAPDRGADHNRRR